MNKIGIKFIKIFFIIFILVFFHYCKKLPYVPDEHAVIYLNAIPTSIEAGGSAKIIILGEKGTGYPLPDGTLIYLNASYGQIENQLSLINGQAETIYQSDVEYSGEVIITAHSGNATISPEQLVITITEVAEPDIFYLYISANPMELPSNGGKSSIQVRALDEEMQPVAGKNIWLETTAGSLSGNGIYKTGANGEVQTTLSTDQTATVTAKYKELSSSVTVTVEEEDEE